MDILIGTGNAGKLREYEELLAGLPVRCLSLRDVGLADMEVSEDGTTLEANAGAKVAAYAQASGLLTLADDTGLFVDALGGEPGVYPARYGGSGLTTAQRRQKLLRELGSAPFAQRTARFVCVIALAQPGLDAVTTVKGICEGHIALVEDDGDNGFGYDPIFIPQGYDIAWSSVPAEEKNRISHRGQAARQIIPILEQLAT
ncbi:MAG: RdgB/HAM1 family non-canonical purine NTP pyrophosphatase [Anaerolineaceae bacterium]|nr:RdgB/HAM1 family non-canonical purine NTP pyrophosphatase [Anaerolineaceae bacterium]